MPQYQLVVRRGPRAGETFELKSQTVIIGRDSTADIIINDPEVSRNHCRLILDRSYYLQDLGSTNGTFVDGSRLGGEPVRLANGQIIQLGSNVTLLHQEIEVGAGIISTQMIPGDDPNQGAMPQAPAAADPPPVFGQSATPPQQPEQPAYQPPAPQQPEQPQYQPPTPQQQPPAANSGYAPPQQPQQPMAPDPSDPPKIQAIQPGSPVDQMRQAYQQQNQGGGGAQEAEPEGGGRLSKMFGGFGGGKAEDSAGPAAPADGGDGGGGMPWANWTQQQWMIAAGVLCLLLLCICCLFVGALVVILNPEVLNQGAGAGLLPISLQTLM